MFSHCMKFTPPKITLTSSLNSAPVTSTRRLRLSRVKSKCLKWWIKSFKDTCKFTKRILFIETSSQPISFWVKIMNVKSLILDLPSRPQNFSSLASTMLDHLCTWPLNLWKEINILTKLIFGLLGSFSSKCWLVKLHGRPKPKKNFSKKLKLKESMRSLREENFLSHPWQ